MFRIDATRVRTLMFERELTITGLARATNLNALTARKIVTDGATVTGKVVGRLAKFFGVSGEVLLDKRKDDVYGVSA